MVAWPSLASAAEVNIARFAPRAEDAGPAFALAIAELARAGGGRLIVPPGVYRFAASDGVALRFAGLAPLDIEAYGAVFLFRGLVRPFLFRDCRNISLRGGTVDWVRPPFSQGEIEAQAADRKSFDIALDEITPMDGWTQVSSLGGYDRESGLMSRRQLDVYNVGDTVEPLGPARARVHLRWPVDLTGARTLLLRHANYGAHAVEARDCADLAIEDMNVIAAPGMAFVAGRTHNIALTRCVIAPRQGLFMSTNADGAHFGDCSGDIRVEGCRFSRMGDDGVNVNSAYRRIVAAPDRRTILLANRGDAPFAPDEKFPAGESYEIASGSTLEARGEVALVSASLELGGARERLAFANDLPPDAAAGDVAVDVSQLPTIVVRDCLFEGNRARGVLAHANATIERCQFRDQTLAGVLLSPDLFWMEGPEVSRVRIADCLFDGVDRWGTKQGAISVDAQVPGLAGRTVTSAGRPNHDIQIERNTFTNIEGPNVLLRATK